jgi:hypothetical protein
MCMIVITIERFKKIYLQNGLGHPSFLRPFLTTTHELVHLYGEEYGRINHNKLKHLNHYFKNLVTK